MTTLLVYLKFPKMLMYYNTNNSNHDSVMNNFVYFVT